MRYEGSIYRPPSEAYSLILQVTIGCAHNECTFCGMFKDKQFRIRPIEEVLEDLTVARSQHKYVEKIFLADGDALVLKNDYLLSLLNYIANNFPECKSIGIYASPQDVLRKTPEELVALKNAGLRIAYMGVESGSDLILKEIKKGVNSAQMVEAGRKLEEAGIKASVTFISGIGGKENWKEHAIASGLVISQMKPSYVGLLTLMVERGTPLYEDIKSGKFHLLSAEQVLTETYELISNINLDTKCVFRSNHASNYLSLAGDLPEDKEKLLNKIKSAMENTDMLKDERFRAL
jgi:radical SAM superfamily enzyme YgiQ (UPF0313 family)